MALLDGPSFYCYADESYIPSRYICADEDLRRLDAVNGFLYFSLQDRLLSRDSDKARLKSAQRRFIQRNHSSDCMSTFVSIKTKAGRQRAQCLYNSMEAHIAKSLWPLIYSELTKTGLSLAAYMGDYKRYSITDIPGHYIGSGVFNVTLERCEQLCNAHGRCKAYTHVSVNETFTRASCWLKSASGPRRIAGSALVSGIRQ